MIGRQARCAILGSGNVGADLMMKATPRSNSLALSAMAGVDPASEGLAVARELGVFTTRQGIDGLIASDVWADIDIVFDATGAGARAKHADFCAQHGKRMIDLTPAAVGPYLPPVANMDQHVDARNISMETCGGQATIPVERDIGAVSKELPYAEIVSSISSRSAGPGARSNIDEFTDTTTNALRVIGGAVRSKAIIVLNPADPPLLMRCAIHALSVSGDPRAITSSVIRSSVIRSSVARMVRVVADYSLGYRLDQEVSTEAMDEAEASPIAGSPVTDAKKVAVLLEVEGADDYLPSCAGNYDINDLGCAGGGGRAGCSSRATAKGGVMTGPAKLCIQDVTLRDGMHAIGHAYSLDQVREIARAPDAAGIDAIEVAHGDGFAGPTFNYGFGARSDWEWIEAAAAVIDRARLTALLIPRIGAFEDLRRARDLGVISVRAATHRTEADVSLQHSREAAALGMDVSGFLMMSHMNSSEGLAAQAKLMESYRANCVYVVDSGGALDPPDVVDRMQASEEVLRPETERGIHAHHNLTFGVANAMAEVENRAVRVDAPLAGMGAGTGNTPLEVFVAAANKRGWRHGCDAFALMDPAEERLRPLQQRRVRVDSQTALLSYAGVFSSFPLHAERAAERHGVDVRGILIELGERGMVGGQDDMIVDVALNIKRRGIAEHLA